MVGKEGLECPKWHTAGLAEPATEAVALLPETRDESVEVCPVRKSICFDVFQ
mgnify:FL=1|jgi:hypothetical protein